VTGPPHERRSSNIGTDGFSVAEAGAILIAPNLTRWAEFANRRQTRH